MFEYREGIVADKFKPGDKIVYIPENKVYDFAYYSQVEGKVIIYIEGCMNMQDSYCVSLNDIVKAPKAKYKYMRN